MALGMKGRFMWASRTPCSNHPVVCDTYMSLMMTCFSQDWEIGLLSSYTLTEAPITAPPLCRFTDYFVFEFEPGSSLCSSNCTSSILEKTGRMHYVSTELRISEHWPYEKSYERWSRACTEELQYCTTKKLRGIIQRWNKEKLEPTITLLTNNVERLELKGKKFQVFSSATECSSGINFRSCKDMLWSIMSYVLSSELWEKNSSLRV